jgi:hypothetical protein
MSWHQEIVPTVFTLPITVKFPELSIRITFTLLYANVRSVPAAVTVQL